MYFDTMWLLKDIGKEDYTLVNSIIISLQYYGNYRNLIVDVNMCILSVYILYFSVMHVFLILL